MNSIDLTIHVDMMTINFIHVTIKHDDDYASKEVNGKNPVSRRVWYDFSWRKPYPFHSNLDLTERTIRARSVSK